MTLQQLEYIVAMDIHHSFTAAAQACYVTQPTLSTMIQKLETELGVYLFDRSKQPVQPTEIGQKVIAQARRVLEEAEQLHLLVKEEKDELEGALTIGVIPTVAPYLLPRFLPGLAEAYPQTRIRIAELTTAQIFEQLKNRTIDIGLLAGPVLESGLVESPVFVEEFMAYAPLVPALIEKEELLPEDIDTSHLLLLEEGHCLRSQVINLCALQQLQRQDGTFVYEAGSLETLRRLVESYAGITILPALALQDMDEKKLQSVRTFKTPAPVREIVLATHLSFHRKQLLQIIKDAIIAALPDEVRHQRKPYRVLSFESA